MKIQSIEVIYHDGTGISHETETASVGVKIHIGEDWYGTYRVHKELQTLPPQEVIKMANECLKELLEVLGEWGIYG